MSKPWTPAARHSARGEHPLLYTQDLLGGESFHQVFLPRTHKAIIITEGGSFGRHVRGLVGGDSFTGELLS